MSETNVWYVVLGSGITLVGTLISSGSTLLHAREARKKEAAVRKEQRRETSLCELQDAVIQIADAAARANEALFDPLKIGNRSSAEADFYQACIGIAKFKARVPDPDIRLLVGILQDKAEHARKLLAADKRSPELSEAVEEVVVASGIANDRVGSSLAAL